MTIVHSPMGNVVNMAAARAPAPAPAPAGRWKPIGPAPRKAPMKKKVLRLPNIRKICFRDVEVPADLAAAVRALFIRSAGVTVMARLVNPDVTYTPKNVAGAIEPWVKLTNGKWVWMLKVPIGLVNGTPGRRDVTRLRRRILMGVHRTLYPSKVRNKAVAAALDEKIAEVLETVRKELAKLSHEDASSKAQGIIDKRRLAAREELRTILQRHVAVLRDEDVSEVHREVWISAQVLIS